MQTMKECSSKLLEEWGRNETVLPRAYQELRVQIVAGQRGAEKKSENKRKQQETSGEAVPKKKPALNSYNVYQAAHPENSLRILQKNNPTYDSKQIKDLHATLYEDFKAALPTSNKPSE
jgi:hypothetical protein